VGLGEHRPGYRGALGLGILKMKFTESLTPNQGRLRSGFGRRNITPRTPCFLAGYPHVERISTGTNDPLLASAVCLESGGEVLVIISLDLLFISAEWAEACRYRIAVATGIPCSNILIGATHTHSGPLTLDILAWRDDPVVPPCDKGYLEFCSSETASAAIEAWENLAPSRLGSTVADVGGLAGGNRIDPRGAEDPEAGLWMICREGESAPMAILSVYGMHPTVLHEDSTLFSGDFIAYTRAHLEQAFPGTGVVYLNGVCGNQSPRRCVRAQTFAEAERLGLSLGARMEEALRGIRDFDFHPQLKSSNKRIAIQGKIFPAVEEASSQLEAARRNYDSLKSANAARAEIRTAECTVFGAEEVLTLAKAEASGEAEVLRQHAREAEIQCFQLGEAFLVAWPGEFFVEYGLEVKAQASRRTFITTMANGELHGYIVTPEAAELGGYESCMSLFPAATGAKFVENTLGLLARMK
jgi:neutral ceramidase